MMEQNTEITDPETINPALIDEEPEAGDEEDPLDIEDEDDEDDDEDDEDDDDDSDASGDVS